MPLSCHCLIPPFSFKAKPFEDLPPLALSTSSAPVLTAFFNQALQPSNDKVSNDLYTAKATDQFPGLAFL